MEHEGIGRVLLVGFAVLAAVGMLFSSTGETGITANVVAPLPVETYEDVSQKEVVCEKKISESVVSFPYEELYEPSGGGQFCGIGAEPVVCEVLGKQMVVICTFETGVGEPTFVEVNKDMAQEYLGNLGIFVEEK